TVRGGDYTTRAFRIEVLEPAELSSLTGTVHLPDYVQRPPQPLNSAAGDIEALVGSKVELRFALSAPAESAAMLVERPAAPGQSVSVEEIALTHGDADATYTGTLVMDNVIGYRLRTTRADTPTYQSRLYALRALPDLPPKLAMSGLELQSEVAIDTVLPVSVEGSDDYGLKSVGIFYRVLPPTGSADDVAWKPIQTWDVADRATTFSAQHTIMPVTLELAEGDRVQVA